MTGGGGKDVLVSVVMPTYNRAHMIAAAARSVLEQTHGRLELIVVDDGSTDATEETVRGLGDARIRYIRLDGNRGAAAARNAGIREAGGEYIAFLDSDDEWYGDKLEKQTAKMASLPEEYGVVYCGFHYVQGGTGRVLDTVTPRQRGDVREVILRQCFLSNPTALARRRCFEACGMFDESLPSCQDWELWIRVARKYRFDFVDEVLAAVSVHGDQISSDLGAKIAARERILDTYRRDLEALPDVYGWQLKRQGLLYCLAGDGRTGRRYFARSLRRDPTRKEDYAHILLSLVAPRWHARLIEERSMTNRDGIIFYF